MTKALKEQKIATLEQVMKALGDPVRISVVRQLLACEEMACGTFDYTVTKATFSHHMKILVDAGIVQQRQDGTKKMSSLRRAELDKKFPGLLNLLTQK